jgi:sec-independent protein translocase protein TatB
MLDVAPTELLLVAVVALLVIGPKDLPKAMRFVGKWVGKARGVARQFRSGFDAMVRESELAEMEKQWAAENERIMREHPTPSLPAPQPEHFAPDHSADVGAVDAEPVMVEQPALFAEPAEAAAPKPKRIRKPKTAAPDEPQS